MAAAGAEVSDGAGDEGSNKGNGLLLYCYNYSYYCQKVIMALHEKKLPFKCRDVQITKGEQYEPWFLQINPKGEVPVLQDGVRIIPDSSRIIEYLEDNFSNGGTPRLVPKDLGPEVRHKVDHFRNLIDQLPAGAITMGSFFNSDVCGERRFPFNVPIKYLLQRMEVNSPQALTQTAERYPEGKEVLLQKAKLQEQKQAAVKDKDQFQRVLAQVEEALQNVETELTLHTREHQNWWLCCESFTIADISLCVLLERLRAVGLAESMWGQNKRPHLANYLARAEKRDSYVRTMPCPPASRIKAFFAHSCPLIIAGVVLAVALTAGLLLARRSRH